jgi:DNA-binding SARP family transcriptional activator
MSDAEGRPGLVIQVIGAFRLLAQDGEDLTPLGRKARALLAILALTPTRRRSRPALQDKLWSDRGPEQGAASLRTTLTEIRKALGERYRDCLVSDLHGIGLVAGRVTVDIDEADLSELARMVEPPQLLEDVDVADEEFEEWLRNQRAAFERRIAASRAALDTVSPGPGPALEPEPKPLCAPATGPRQTAAAILRPWVRLLPPLTVSSEIGLFLSRLVGSHIAQGLADKWGIDVRDEGRAPHGVQVRVDALPVSRDVVVTIVLLSAEGTLQLWSGSETISQENHLLFEAPRLLALVNRAIDVVGQCLNRIGTSLDGSRGFMRAFEAVQRMFKIDLPEVDRADALLGEAYELDAKPVYLAWRAYSRIFYVGEHIHADRRRVIEEAEEYARRAIEADPHNATVLALASYVYSFIFHNFPLAHEFAELSVRCNPAHPLGHASLGRAKSYLGEYDAGYAATRRGLDFSGQAPYRYMLHFLHGMAALLSGRFNEAARAGEIACAMAPTFRPPQRYLVPLYLHAGKRDQARETMERLRQIEPTFSLEVMREPSYPSAGIRASGLLTFSDRDL